MLLEIHLLQKKLLKLGKNMNQFYGRKCLFQKNTSAAYLRINVLGCLVPVWRLPRPSWSMHFGDISEIHGLLGQGSGQSTWNSFNWTHKKWNTGNQCGQRYNPSCKVTASVCVCVFNGDYFVLSGDHFIILGHQKATSKKIERGALIDYSKYWMTNQLTTQWLLIDYSLTSFIID